MSDEERMRIAQDICLPLIEKMKVDLMFWKEKSSEDVLWKYRNNAEIDNWRHIRTRLYFTSASHMYSLINILVLGQDKFLLSKTPQEEAEKIKDILYMGYLSHIEFRLYENLTMEDSDPNRFRLEISLSTEYKQDKEMKEFSLGGTRGYTINEINDFFQGLMTRGSEKEISPNRSSSIKREDST
jgi:inositol hexakisphosphate/diphosphoinositol-pentakisphosphate kinase